MARRWSARRVNRDGTIDAAGDAIGGNAHLWDGEDGGPRFSDYAGCGARAGFGTMIRVPDRDGVAAGLFADLVAID